MFVDKENVMRILPTAQNNSSPRHATLCTHPDIVHGRSDGSVQRRKASHLRPQNGFKHGQGRLVVARIKGNLGLLVQIPARRVVHRNLRVTGIPHARHVRSGHLVAAATECHGLMVVVIAAAGIAAAAAVVVVSIIFQESRQRSELLVFSFVVQVGKVGKG